MLVEKRDKSKVKFDTYKIEKAIIKAMKETDKGIDEILAKTISNKVKERYSTNEIINIEKIQDMVEVELMDSERKDVAKRYILYREDRAKIREKGWEMSDLQKDIYQQKYRFEGEIFSDFLDRVSGGNKPISKAISGKYFLPAGRILAGRGLDKLGKKITLSNCYVMPKVEDNIESIFDTAKHLARTYSYGGGCGLTLTNLRPKGSKVNNAANTTTGAVSFMELFSMVTGLIGMRGRRGALMLNIDVHHPDIIDFINVKNDLDKVNSANISVNVDNKFMEAVKNDEDYELYFKVESSGEEIKRNIKAKELFRLLAENNWNMAEPGVLYQNRINEWNLMSEDDTFEFAGVNPCAEETLPAFGSCNLSSINLGKLVNNEFTDKAEFDYEEFSELVRNGVIYLNEVLDENMELHPLKEQREVSRDLRQIGLGIMGTADLFIKMGIKYGSDKSLELSHKIGRVMINEALRQSSMLAKKDGAFPRYREDAIFRSKFFIENIDDDVKELVKKYGIRNSQLLTIAPTGSTSTLIGCSNGIEPIFQISYTRKTESLHGQDTYYKVFTPVAKEYMDKYSIEDEDLLPDYFVTTSNLDYRDRINVQSVWQNYIDASISSTVNVPNEFTVEDVEGLYLLAWEKGLKGITIYRDGCARSGILITEKPKEQTREEKIEELKQELEELSKDNASEECPMCGGKLVHSGGCLECLDCGYSPCSI